MLLMTITCLSWTDWKMVFLVLFLSLWSFHSIAHFSLTSLESIHRFFIDSLVVPLCRHFNLKIRAEIDIKSEDFLTNILDYTLCAGEKPVFVIEAKRWTAFSPKAVAQLVLQLCSVDRMLSGEVVVGVLTDGSHFFFVVKTPQGCYFGKEVITLRTKKDLEVLFLCFHKSLEFIRGSK